MTRQDTPAAPTAESNKALVVGAVQAALGGDVESFFAALHPEVEVHEPPYLPYGGVYRGREGFAALFGEATKVLDLPSLTIDSVTADAEKVVLLMTARHIASGEDVIVTEHWRPEDGLIREVRVFWFSLPDAG